MHESELGTPLYRRSEAVAVNGDFRRAITVEQCSVGVVRESSVITEVQWVRFSAKLAGVWVFGSSSTKRGGAGPSAAESALRACCATATVPHACAGTETATRSYQRIWAAPNGVEPPFWFLSAATALRPPQDTPAQAGQGATDARKEPSARVELRTRRRGCEQRAKCAVYL